MGKLYCKVDKKWCKFLKRGICTYCKSDILSVSRCPRLAEIETVRFSKIVHESDFKRTFNHLVNWWPDQAKCKEYYLEVFNKLKNMVPKKHNFSDMFIDIDSVIEDDKEYPDVSGKFLNNKHLYAIEFFAWHDWISMFVTKNTLKQWTINEITAACLYEMTFYGFDEDTILESNNELIESIKEIQNKKSK